MASRMICKFWGLTFNSPRRWTGKVVTCERREAGRLAQAKLPAYLNQAVAAGPQALLDEVGVARLDERPPEIVIPRFREVPDLTPAQLIKTGTVQNLFWIQARLERREADDD